MFFRNLYRSYGMDKFNNQSIKYKPFKLFILQHNRNGHNHFYTFMDYNRDSFKNTNIKKLSIKS